MNIQRSLKIFFCIPVILQVIILCSILFCLTSLKQEIDRQIQYKHLQAVIDKFQRKQTESLASAFCANASGYERITLQNQNSILELERLLPELRAEFADRPDLLPSITEIERSEKQLIKFQEVMQKISLPVLFKSPGASMGMAVLVKGALGSVRQLVSKLEDTAVVNNSGWSKQWLIGLVATLGVFTFELALAINWSSRIFGGRLKKIFERIAEFDRGELTSVAPPPMAVSDEFAQVEASVLKANYEIAQLEESRRELSSIVAHDIRAPLTSIAGSLELLEQGVFGELPEKSQPEFSKVRQVSNNLIFAANLLLQFSKPTDSDRQLKLSSAERIEDSIYEALDEYGLEGLKDFTCVVETAELSLPEGAVGKLVAFLIQAMGQPDGVTVTITQRDDCALIKTSFPLKTQDDLDSFQKLQQESSLKMIAMMLGIHNARLTKEIGKTYDIQFSFPQKQMRTARLANIHKLHDSHDEGERVVVGTGSSKSSRSFHRTLVTLLIVTISINLLTVCALAYAWQRGQSQLSSETESRNAIYRASVVTANVTEIVLVSVFNTPHLERYRKSTYKEIEKSFHRLEKQVPTISRDHLLDWKRNVEKILALSKEIASVPSAEMPEQVKRLIDNDRLDVLLTQNSGRLLVADEQASTTYSKRLLKLFEQIKVQIICISIVGACASIGAAMFLSRYLIARLEHVKNNADALVHKRALSSPLFGSDDIAHLDRFFYEAASRIEELERNKIQLSSLLRDDLSTLIAQMRERIEDVIATDDVPDRAKEQLDTVHSALARLSLLVDDLECSNSLGAGAKEALQIDVVPTSVGTVIADTIGATAYQAKLKNVEIVIANQCEHDALVKADPKRLVQVLVNLLSNAIKISSPGSEVIVEAIRQNDEVTIAIVDSGKGIEPQVMDKLFQRFSTTGENAGVGLGLYISKFLVDVQGGTIGVTSKPSQGSRFWVKLPIGS